MPRAPAVRRKMVVTECTVLTVNTITGRQETVTLYLPRTYQSNEKLLSVVRKRYESSAMSIARVISSRVYTINARMSEFDFVERCTIVDKTEVQP